MIIPKRGNPQRQSASPARVERTVVLVQDDAADAILLTEALIKEDKTSRVEILTNGEQALAYFSGEGGSADRRCQTVPIAIICDLDLAGLSGIALLAWLQAQPKLATIPFFVLTASGQPRDMQRAYALGAQECLGKPISRQGLASLVQAVAGRKDSPQASRTPGSKGAGSISTPASGEEPGLKEIIVGSSSENPGIHARKQYRVRIGKDWYEGAFSRQWFGWCFDGFGASGMQLNLIEEVFEIQGPGSSRKMRHPRNTPVSEGPSA